MDELKKAVEALEKALAARVEENFVIAEEFLGWGRSKSNGSGFHNGEGDNAFPPDWRCDYSAHNAANGRLPLFDTDHLQSVMNGMRERRWGFSWNEDFASIRVINPGTGKSDTYVSYSAGDTDWLRNFAASVAKAILGERQKAVERAVAAQEQDAGLGAVPGEMIFPGRSADNED